jgi:D-arabinose 1-dehydrogenase-like Zn-dependent alcohol dehydrogenase
MLCGSDIHIIYEGVTFLFCGSCSNCITGYMEVCVNRKIAGIQENGGLAEYSDAG